MPKKKRLTRKEKRELKRQEKERIRLEKLQDKRIAELERAQQREDKKRRAALDKRKKELKKKEKENERIIEAKKKRKQDEEDQRNRVVWIDSTQMCIPIKDVYRSIIVTADGRYLKLIEVKPNNFSTMHIRKQNLVSNIFADMLTIVPYQIQFKCFSRLADVDKQIREIKEEFANEQNSTLVEMQEDYLNLVRNTASTVGVTRRFFAIIQYQATGIEKGQIDAVVDGLNSLAGQLKGNIAECGCQILDTGDTTAGVTSVLYEIINRRMSEEIPFETHVRNVMTAYEEANAPIDKETGEPMHVIPTANEIIAPRWLDFTHPNYCVADEKFYRFYYIDSDGYKDPTWAGWLSTFIEYGAGVDVDIFIRHIPAESVQEKIARNQRLNMAKENTSENADFYAMQDRIQSGRYLMEGLASGQSYYEFCILLTLSADSIDDLNELNSSFVRTAKTSGIKIRSCMFQNEQAFYSSLPICQIDKTIWRKGHRNVLTDGAGALYPFLSFELQDPKGIMMGVNNYNYSLALVNLFNTKAHPNANVSIIGKSGYGKTFTSQLIAIRERLQGIQVFVITPMSGKEDYYRICTRLQGQFVSMGTGTRNYINIFDIHAMDTTIEVDGMEKSLLDQKVNTLHIFFGLIVKDMTLEENQLLDRYLYEAYNERGITTDNDSIYYPGTTQYRECPYIEDIYKKIKEVPELRRVANIIYPYVYGVHSEYNKPTNIDLSNKYIVFDLDGLKGDDLALALFVCLDYVWSKIKENKADRKAVFIDEIWKLIGMDGNDTAAEYCVEIYKTIRKYGGSACCMTQELTDFFKLKDGKYGKAIISNSDTKICLRVDDAEVRKLEDVMELSESEKDMIPKLKRGEGLLVTGDSRIKVSFRASAKETQAINTDPSVIRAEREANKRRLEGIQKLQDRNSTQSQV